MTTVSARTEETQRLRRGKPCADFRANLRGVQRPLLVILALAVDISLPESRLLARLVGNTSDDDNSAVERARQRAVAIDNGTQGLVSDVEPFSYRAHDDVQVQVLIKQGPLRNHIYWTTAGELIDASGHKFLR